MSGPIAPTLRSGSLPLLVLLMTVLAGLALAGLNGVQTLARTWTSAAANVTTIEIPSDTNDLDRKAAHLLHTLTMTPGVTDARILPEDRIRSLLAPWLGTLATDRSTSLTFPAVLTLHHAPAVALAPLVASELPNAVVEEDQRWSQRLQNLGSGLVGCAWLAVSLIGSIAVVSVGITVRRSVAAQRRSIEIIHAIGATDRQIASRIASRAALLSFIGSLLGLACLTPILTTLASYLAPFQNHPIAPQGTAGAILATLPHALLKSLALLPVVSAILSWLTAQSVVRFWLQRLP